VAAVVLLGGGRLIALSMRDHAAQMRAAAQSAVARESRLIEAQLLTLADRTGEEARRASRAARAGAPSPSSSPASDAAPGRGAFWMTAGGTVVRAGDGDTAVSRALANEWTVAGAGARGAAGLVPGTGPRDQDGSSLARGLDVRLRHARADGERAAHARRARAGAQTAARGQRAAVQRDGAAPGAAEKPRACPLPRPLHRAAEPPLPHGSTRSCAARGAHATPAAHRGRSHRDRSLQADQRHAGPHRGRRADAAGGAALRPRGRGDAMRAVALGGRAAGAAPVRGGIARGRTGARRQAPERPPGALYAAPAAHQRRLPYRTHLYRLGPATRGRSAARGGYRALVRQAAAGPE